jgi:hypothetical protein
MTSSKLAYFRQPACLNRAVFRQDPNVGMHIQHDSVPIATAVSRHLMHTLIGNFAAWYKLNSSGVSRPGSRLLHPACRSGANLHPKSVTGTELPDGIAIVKHVLGKSAPVTDFRVFCGDPP